MIDAKLVGFLAELEAGLGNLLRLTGGLASDARVDPGHRAARRASSSPLDEFKLWSESRRSRERRGRSLKRRRRTEMYRALEPLKERFERLENALAGRGRRARPRGHVHSRLPRRRVARIPDERGKRALLAAPRRALHATHRLVPRRARAAASCVDVRVWSGFAFRDRRRARCGSATACSRSGRRPRTS